MVEVFVVVGSDIMDAMFCFVLVVVFVIPERRRRTNETGEEDKWVCVNYERIRRK